MVLLLLWFLTHHSMKNCWKVILFSLRAQNKSISPGRIFSAERMLVDPLLSLSLHSCYCLRCKDQRQYQYVLHSHIFGWKCSIRRCLLWYVHRLSFLSGTFLTCPMKSAIFATIMLDLGTFDRQTGTVFLSAFLSSLLFAFRYDHS